MATEWNYYQITMWKLTPWATQSSPIEQSDEENCFDNQHEEMDHVHTVVSLPMGKGSECKMNEKLPCSFLKWGTGVNFPPFLTQGIVLLYSMLVFCQKSFGFWFPHPPLSNRLLLGQLLRRIIWHFGKYAYWFLAQLFQKVKKSAKCKKNLSFSPISSLCAKLS